MLRHHDFALLAILIVFWQPGCTAWTQPAEVTQVHQHESPQFEASPITAIERRDIGDLEVGQCAKIWTSSPIESTSSKMEPRMIAGRVLMATTDEVVLSECVGFEGPGAKRGVLLIHKVPYVSRLFKMTGIGLMPTPVAGAVRLAKSSMVSTYPIAESEWDFFRQHRHFERICY